MTQEEILKKEEELKAREEKLKVEEEKANKTLAEIDEKLKKTDKFLEEFMGKITISKSEEKQAESLEDLKKNHHF